MTQQPLSRMERIALRDVWPDEARDFTKWLAENISVLGDALGLELKVQQREASVGGYSLDLLAADSDGQSVVIENQLDSSDHDHLGKLLTYAGGRNASVVVWVAQEFRDEHRQALDWLNQQTNRQTRFFAVTVEVLKIGDSQAPYFRVVASPNRWSKHANDWRLARKYGHFRMGLEERLRESDLPLDEDYDHDGAWMCIAMDKVRSYEIDFDDGIELSIGIDRTTFNQLESDRDSIESVLGQLAWQSVWEWKTNKESYIWVFLSCKAVDGLVGRGLCLGSRNVP